jgi:hypothetical protein
MDGEITGYTLSVALNKKIKASGVKDPRYYIYASLRGSGMSMRDSWAIAFQGHGLIWSKEVLEREMNKLEALSSVQARIAEVQGVKEQHNSEDMTAEELAEATSKETILKNLVIAQRRQKLGSTEWQKTTAMIADYNKIKQDELDTQDNTIHFFLPVRYPAQEAKKGKAKG